MSRITLIHPPMPWRAGSFWEGVSSRMPPLGLAWMASELLKRGHMVAIIDAQALGLDADRTAAAAGESGPDWVGLTATTTIYPGALAVARRIKERVPGITTVLGGVHPTIFPEETVRDPAVDFAVFGEGERTLPELIENADRPWTVDGVAFMRDGQPELARPRELIPELDALPRPAYHLLPMSRYRPALGGYKRLPAVNMLVTRGCKGRCMFCYNRMWGGRIRHFSAERILDDLGFLVRVRGIREVVFYDDAFTCLRELAAEVCEGMLARGLDLTWSCMSRVDCVDAELLGLMRRAGCHQVCFGVESGDDQTLARIGKAVTTERIEQAVAATKRAGIDVRGSFIFGHPDETLEHLQRTLDFAVRLGPEVVQFNIATPFPGTRLYDWARGQGFLREADWNEFDYFTPVIEQPQLPPERLEAFLKSAYRKYYLRPGFVLKKLRRDFRPSQLVQYVRAAASLMGRR